jgi:molybdate transport system permease protein
MTAEEWQLLWVTLRLSALGTLIMLPPGVAAAWLLARRDWRGKSLFETFVALPLVMPPIATGLLLLKCFGRHGPVGGWLYERFGIDVVFTWRGVAIALAVMAFPLFVRSARVAFEEVNPRLEQIARTLGASPWRVFYSVTVPLARRGLAAGLVLAFARALGEFGATIMVAGNIPGETSTLSLAIYQAVQLGEDSRAYRLLAISTVLAFGAIWTSELLQRRKRKRR